MFGIGGGELFLIAFVALIVFGPQRIPELARTAARGYRELLKLRRQVDSTLDDVKRDLRLDQELHDIGLDGARASDAPPIRAPQGERASASASTVSRGADPPGGEKRDAPAGGMPSHSGVREPFSELPVPVEDDYLGPRGGSDARDSADPADYLGGGR